MNKLYKRSFQLDDILKIDINQLTPRSSQRGQTGLKNLGNTCFMNSALQCLSHTEELTKYFLLNKYLEEINKKNKYGSGGSIAKAYYELIKELWMGRQQYLSPWDFRQIFVGFVKQFAGFCQHDSHEMLAFMLDALHEDLNRVKEKPYFELKEKEITESEAEASNRWWESHLSRENSIIVDLFHGQYKSKITCPQCNRISITYDPFMYLGLPIPQGQFKVQFKFFPLVLENTNDIHSVEFFYMAINEHTTLKEVKESLISKINPSIKMNNLEAILTSDKQFKKRIPNNVCVLPYYENNYEVIIYETEISIEDEQSKNCIFYINPVIFSTEDKSFMGMRSKTLIPLFYPKPFILAKSFTVRDLYLFILQYYRKIFKDKVDPLTGELRTYQHFKNNIRDINYVKQELKSYFSSSEGKSASSPYPFRLHIINNVTKSNNPYQTNMCEFCGKDCDYCIFSFELNCSIEEILRYQKHKRPFVLYLEVLNFSNVRLFDKIDVERKRDSDLIQKTSGISIYDCMDAFRMEEKLEKDNSWYCSKCKEHQEAFKKLEIYKAPNILIIQLKRFKIKTTNVLMGQLANRKNDSVVQFPINGLDLKNYIVCENNRNDALYDLFAVSQHFGGLSSGHYTALGRSKNIWYNFDDERVSQTNENNIVNSAAYLLFYRKKSLDLEDK
jgi:ubiquitin carboxyl-terminal hydrolase 4/11/15